MGTDPVRARTNIAYRYHNLPPFRPPLPLLLFLEQAGARDVLHEEVILKQILPEYFEDVRFQEEPMDWGSKCNLNIQHLAYVRYVLGRSCLSEEAKQRVLTECRSKLKAAVTWRLHAEEHIDRWQGACDSTKASFWSTKGQQTSWQASFWIHD